ncbi:L-2-hydroxyglutarate oxidase [Piscirickettsia litoralis]|uniref:L-2-hydroxyglutarate oxidase n=1 Tax=Piscirickettsia litoralis TaxID=1891921 RepID=UPI00228583BD|nr:L-2-hydroxyglutarate oxidase [Piscirickettsia litoralis]
MIDIFVESGGEVIFNQEVSKISEFSEHVLIKTQNKEYITAFMISCAGLMSDRLVKKAGLKNDFSIVPFKGSYYQLPNHTAVSKHLIYPIPDPKLPFLGVHLTRMIDGSTTVGPNAAISFARENYKSCAVNFRDSRELVFSSNFWKLLRRYLKPALHELKLGYCKKAYLKAIQKYCPSLTLSDLAPYPPGIRAQAVSLEGKLIHDFLFTESKRMVHVCNAPSPAATAAIPIGEHIIQRVQRKQDRL